LPKPKSGLSKRDSDPTILCINHATEKLGVDFDELIAALQKFVDEHFAPVWGIRANLEKAKSPRSGTWTLLFTDDQDSADHAGWLGLHHLEGNPMAKVFVGPVKKHHEKVSVAASHEIAEMLVDPAINLWAIGPKGLLYAYEVCDAVEEEKFDVDGIAMCNFVYPAYFELFREPKSTQFDHKKKLKHPFQILPRGYATVLKNGKKIDIPGSGEKEDDFKNEIRTDHRSEYRKMLHLRQPNDTTKFSATLDKKKQPKKRRAKK
jgi:hypothetical protein